MIVVLAALVQAAVTAAFVALVAAVRLWIRAATEYRLYNTPEQQMAEHFRGFAEIEIGMSPSEADEAWPMPAYRRPQLLHIPGKPVFWTYAPCSSPARRRRDDLLRVMWYSLIYQRLPLEAELDVQAAEQVARGRPLRTVMDGISARLPANAHDGC